MAVWPRTLHAHVCEHNMADSPTPPATRLTNTSSRQHRTEQIQAHPCFSRHERKATLPVSVYHSEREGHIAHVTCRGHPEQDVEVRAKNKSGHGSLKGKISPSCLCQKRVCDVPCFHVRRSVTSLCRTQHVRLLLCLLHRLFLRLCSLWVCGTWHLPFSTLSSYLCRKCFDNTSSVYQQLVVQCMCRQKNTGNFVSLGEDYKKCWRGIWPAHISVESGRLGRVVSEQRFSVACRIDEFLDRCLLCNSDDARTRREQHTLRSLAGIFDVNAGYCIAQFAVSMARLNTAVPWRSARIAAHCSRQMLPWRRNVAPTKFQIVTVRLDTLRKIHHSAVAWVVRKTLELFRNASGWPLSGQGKAFGFQEKSWSTVARGASFLIDFRASHGGNWPPSLGHDGHLPSTWCCW